MAAPRIILERRLVVVAVVLAGALGLTIYLLWPYLLACGVLAAAWKVLGRGTRRRRPRSSWSSLGRTGALMYGAWNTRFLKQVTNPVRVSVPKSADGGSSNPIVDELEDVIPF